MTIPPRRKLNKKKARKKSMRFPQYQTGSEKGQETRIWIKINNIRLIFLKAKISSSEEKEEGIGYTPHNFRVDCD